MGCPAPIRNRMLSLWPTAIVHAAAAPAAPQLQLHYISYESYFVRSITVMMANIQLNRAQRVSTRTQVYLQTQKKTKHARDGSRPCAIHYRTPSIYVQDSRDRVGASRGPAAEAEITPPAWGSFGCARTSRPARTRVTTPARPLSHPSPGGTFFCYLHHAIPNPPAHPPIHYLPR